MDVGKGNRLIPPAVLALVDARARTQQQAKAHPQVRRRQLSAAATTHHHHIPSPRTPRLIERRCGGLVACTNHPVPCSIPLFFARASVLHLIRILPGAPILRPPTPPRTTGALAVRPTNHSRYPREAQRGSNASILELGGSAFHH